MLWKWTLVLLALLLPTLARAAPVTTLQYTEPNCGGSCTGNLDYCEWEYCGATGSCTPNAVLPGSRTQSNNGNGGTTVTLSNVNAPLQAGQTTACFRVYCVDKFRTTSFRSSTVCCVGGTCS